MPSATSTELPVLVVGGGLAGMAAAARLAKSGHRVELLEARDRLGGTWAPYDFQGRRVDAAPSVLGFPAPWRDLFRKSGRPLEAELARSGHALEPAAPARYLFSDGAELVLPTERGEQYASLTATFGRPAAERWRALVDDLDRVWQVVRPLGLESELRSRHQLKPARKALWSRKSLDQLAAELDEPHLAAVVRSVAYRLGSHPVRTPAWCAVELSVQRTFGRWTIGSDSIGSDSIGSDSIGSEGAPTDRGRSSVLVDTLAARLALRRVTVRLDTRVTGLSASDHRVTAVQCADGSRLSASAVVCTVDPWQAYAELWPEDLSWRQRRLLRSWRPAVTPAVEHRLETGDGDGVQETVSLSAAGVPIVSYRRPTPGGTLHTTHDYARATPRPAAGLAWDGFRSWSGRPPVTTGVRGLFLAGPFSPGGNAPSSVVLSGALAAYGAHDDLDEARNPSPAAP
jgi:phytoene dehydrogenase-like protein